MADSAVPVTAAPMREVDRARAAGRESYNLFDELGISFGSDGFARVNARQMSPAQLAAAAPTDTARPVVVEAVAPANLTFGSAMSALPQGTTASGNLSFSPLKVYSPEQQRIKQLASAFAGMPTDMFQQMMAGMPERPASPSIEDMAGQDYYNLALKNFTTNMTAATSAEEQDAALQSFMDSLLTLRKTNALLAPQVGGN